MTRPHLTRCLRWPALALLLVLAMATGAQAQGTRRATFTGAMCESDGASTTGYLGARENLAPLTASSPYSTFVCPVVLPADPDGSGRITVLVTALSDATGSSNPSFCIVRTNHPTSPDIHDSATLTFALTSPGGLYNTQMVNVNVPATNVYFGVVVHLRCRMYNKSAGPRNGIAAYQVYY